MSATNNNDNGNGKITGKTLVPIGVFGTLLMLVLSGVVWVMSQINEIDLNIADLNHSMELKLRELDNKIDVKSADRWTYTDMIGYSEDLKTANKGNSLVIPTPRRAK